MHSIETETHLFRGVQNKNRRWDISIVSGIGYAAMRLLVGMKTFSFVICAVKSRTFIVRMVDVE